MSGNSAPRGGLIVGAFTATLTNSTVSENHGDGLLTYLSTVTLKNSIIAKQALGVDCQNFLGSGSLISDGYNLDSDGTCRLVAAVPNSDPLLGPLQYNGGPTWTHALPLGSPAVDAIPPGTNGCGDPDVTDQRGVPRPQGVGCDIGAFEFQRSGKTLTSLEFGKLWVGLKNSDAVGLRLDLRVDVYLDDVPIGEGQLDNVPAGSSGFNNAVLRTVSLVLLDGPVGLPQEAELQFRVAVRRTCSGGGHNSGPVRLWFNGAAIDSGARRDAGSRFGATIDDETVDYFLRSGFALSTTAGASRQYVDVNVDSRVACPSRPFTTFGVWTITPYPSMGPRSSAR